MKVYEVVLNPPRSTYISNQILVFYQYVPVF